ncbi:SPOSA6832_01746 [Sporobolomyces salmonicolor]|uniref:Holocytochrome c-type synthase n=1 Tax=Sporidiobolus salmonicolor TaxID=5005 RepID=A0A0D6EJJ5_SPOSA|nr:SPOSA6832_01746 [Sporobolomyces salmonicolor]
MWPFTSVPSPADPAPPSACPVDHSTREQWLAQNPSARPSTAPLSDPSSEALPPRLSTEREVSTIPRWLPPSQSSSPSSSPSASPSSPAPPSSAAEPPSACPAHSAHVPAPSSVEQAATVPSEPNWVYPSPASFYAALERKQRNPNPNDMGIVVPIHNAVNERVWAQVLDWERRAMGLPEGTETGVKLVSFIGRPKDVSPRARWKTLIGCEAFPSPFFFVEVS